MKGIVRVGMFPLTFACYVSSFFLPTVAVRRWDPPYGEVVIPGWTAAVDSVLFAIVNYWQPPDERGAQVIVLLMFAANVFMLLFPFLVFWPRPKFLTWTCCVFLLPVLSTFSPMLFPVLYVPRWLFGYYVWASSVAIAYISVVAYGLSIRWSERAPAGVDQL